jgi:O-antigen ligase
LAVRAWFVVGFFFIAGHLFLADPTRIRKGVMLYVFPLAAVVLYTVIRHAALGFEKDAGHWVMKPFYKDHTSYGAVLAMVIPASLALLTAKRSTPILRVFMALAMGILVVGLILSYTRAAWVSLAVAAALYALMKLGIKLRPLLAVGVVVLSFGWLAQDSLLIQLERNEQDSSDNLSEHVESISNVSSDASNLERLNRWGCALALFQEKPLLGWGPGTYQFVYAPFQRSEDRTIISTNNADGGNAHSEYLGPMAEQGVLGLLAMLALLAYVLHLGFKLQRTLTDPEERAMAMAVFLGLMTYFVHGFLNNYLDTDKASALFWGFIAMLVVWDIHSRKTHPRLAESAS